MSFRFLDPGPLVDRELELVSPDEKWIDSVLQACAHPASQGDERCGATTRESLREFLQIAPRGRHPAEGSRVPAYSFWMHLLPQYDPPVPIAGGCNLRIGDTYEIEMYYGQIGYNVYPPARGKHLAERACRLVLPLARAHGMKTLWITCNPDNWPSRRTCERLGAEMVEIVPLPPDNPLYQRGETSKCRYRLSL